MRAQKSAVQVGAQHLTPFGERGLQHRLEPRHTGIVHQRIDAPEPKRASEVASDPLKQLPNREHAKPAPTTAAPHHSQAKSPAILVEVRSVTIKKTGENARKDGSKSAWTLYAVHVLTDNGETELTTFSDTHAATARSLAGHSALVTYETYERDQVTYFNLKSIEPAQE